MRPSGPRRIPRILLTLLAGLLLALPTTASPAAAATGGPATAADLVNLLDRTSGNHTVSGQHDREPNASPAQWTNKVYDITGVHPGMWEGDFLYGADDIAHRQTMVDEAKAEWASGSLVGLMWHECPPTMSEPCSWSDVQSKLTAAQWNDLVTAGTPLNTAWKAELDRIVPYLQQLKAAGIPVLWRPLHEINDSWSWWGGNADSARLYQITHDYLAGTKGLTNLVWVWSVKDDDTATAASYYPANQYVDVVALDSWNAGFPSSSWYQTMQSIAAGKPIALAEVGRLPAPADLGAQPRWAYFSEWAEYLTGSNSTAAVQATYSDPQVLHRGDLVVPSHPAVTGPTGPVTGLAGKCMDVRAANSANGTPVQLYTCNGGTAQSWTMASDGTVQARGKCLDVSGGTAADGTAVQLWDCDTGNAHQQWQYDASTRRLVNPQTGRCLDVTGQNSADSTPLQIWTCNGQTNQRWTVPTA